MQISPKEIAQIGQYSENIYFGKPSGLMDQMTCSVGGFVYIDFANPANPKTEKIEADLSDYSVCMVDTKSTSGDQSAEYALIVAEMKSVAVELGREFLNEIGRTDFEMHIPALREKCSDRAILRAMHFYGENDRVAKVAKALRENDTAEFIKKEKESGKSSYMYLQNACSPDEYLKQDIPLALAISDKILKEDEAARIHASGFGGVMEAFVKNENVEAYRKRMEETFSNCACTVLKIRKYGGIQVI